MLTSYEQRAIDDFLGSNYTLTILAHGLLFFSFSLSFFLKSIKFFYNNLVLFNSSSEFLM